VSDAGGHDHGHGHGHGHEEDPGPVELPAGERIELLSAGIDVGSATCQLALSRLVLVREGLTLSSRYAVVGCETVVAERLGFTTYRPDGSIDADAVSRLFVDALAASGTGRGDIDTGVVLLTGEAVRRTNARELAASLGQQVGDFVCAAAGHSMEGYLAAHGSGAAERAVEIGGHVLSVDVGGGTTKVSLCGPGGVAWTFALHVGGRLVAFDTGGRIVRLETAGVLLAGEVGLEWAMGDAVPEADVRTVAEHMAGVVAAFLPHGSARDRRRYAHHLLRPFPGYCADVEEVVVSGGVATFVTAERAAWREDIGAELGTALWSHLDEAARRHALPFGVADAVATVVGASRQTVQLTGNTVFVSPRAVLPLRNLRVVDLDVDLPHVVTPGDIAAGFEARAQELEEARGTGGFAVTVRWRGAPSFDRLRQLAEGLALGLQRHVLPGEPVVLVLDRDVARLVGALLDEQVGARHPVVVLDGIDAQAYDYLDVGSWIPGSATLPVTVKSLLFE
jgi:ethanolamine utilization protein EutA